MDFKTRHSKIISSRFVSIPLHLILNTSEMQSPGRIQILSVCCNIKQYLPLKFSGNLFCTSTGMRQVKLINYCEVRYLASNAVQGKKNLQNPNPKQQNNIQGSNSQNNNLQPASIASELGWESHRGGRFVDIVL